MFNVNLKGMGCGQIHDRLGGRCLINVIGLEIVPLCRPFELTLSSDEKYSII